VPGACGLDRIDAAKPCCEIGGGKAITRGRGVDHGFGQGLGPHLARTAGKTQDAGRLREFQHHFRARYPRHQGGIAFAGIKRQQILGRCQHDIGGLERGAIGGPRNVEVRPAAGAEIGVEGKAGPEQARACERRHQARPPATRVRAVPGGE